MERMTFKKALSIALKNADFKRTYDYMMDHTSDEYDEYGNLTGESKYKPRCMYFEIDGRIFRADRDGGYYQYTGTQERAHLRSFEHIWQIKEN